MPREIAPELLNALGSETLTIAYCWQITRIDGEVFRFTSHDHDLDFAGHTWNSTAGFNPTANSSDLGLNVDNLQLRSFFSPSHVTQQDVIRGKFDKARVLIFLINYLDLPSSLSLNPPKHLVLANGVIGEVKKTDLVYEFELRGLASLLSQRTTTVTSKLCRYALGDERCTKNLAAFTNGASVTELVDRRNFGFSITRPNGFFQYGTATFIGGQNEGVTRVVRDNVTTGPTLFVELFEQLPFAPEVGDSVVLEAGCDKQIATCRDKFDNVINFGGEPHVVDPADYIYGRINRAD